MAITGLFSKLSISSDEPHDGSASASLSPMDDARIGHVYPPQNAHDKANAFMHASRGANRGGFVNVDLGESLPSPRFPKGASSPLMASSSSLHDQSYSVSPVLSTNESLSQSALGQPGLTSYPPPATQPSNISHIMSRITQLLQEHSPALYDSLSEGLPENSPELESLEKAIYPYKLPECVIESWRIFNGQDPDSSLLSGRAPPGLFWGLWWMSPDEVEMEWRFWRKSEHLDNQNPSDSKVHSSDLSPGVLAHGDGSDAPNSRTTSFPPGWVKKKYSHPAWIPLLTDRAGNYIGLDLEPPVISTTPNTSATANTSSATSAKGPNTSDSSVSTPSQQAPVPGQVIAFGREIDDKVVLYGTNAPDGWAKFLTYFLHSIESADFAILGDSFRQFNVSRHLHVQQPPKDDDTSTNPDASTVSFAVPSSQENSMWSDLSDGYGEDYIDGARYGDDAVDDGPSGLGGSSANGTHHVWHIIPAYRQWLSIDGSGGLVGIIADQARTQWILSGYGVDEFRARSSRAASFSSNRSNRSNRASTLTPQQSTQISDNAASGTTTNVNNPSTYPNTSTSDPSLKPNSLEPPRSSLGVRVSPTSSPNTSLRGHDDGFPSPARSTFSLSSSGTTRRSRNPPPPPPQPLDLPTLNALENEDLDLVIESPGLDDAHSSMDKRQLVIG